MPTQTYQPLATVTLGSSASSVTFSNIPATYRDLILVVQTTMNFAAGVGVRFNGDTGNNYSSVTMQGNGSVTNSYSWTSQNNGFYGVLYDSLNNAVIQVMDYSATDKHKTFLARSNNSANLVRAHATRWANTAAITSMTLMADGASYASGSTFNLFGVVA